MLVVIGAVLCCAVIPVVLGIAAILGFSKKAKAPSDWEEAIPHQERK